MKLNIRIPHEQITTFDIDTGMTTLLLGTSAGHVYVYDLAKALENERVLAKKRIEMGVEEGLVVVKLERASGIKEVIAANCNGLGDIGSCLSGKSAQVCVLDDGA